MTSQIAAAVTTAPATAPTAAGPAPSPAIPWIALDLAVGNCSYRQQLGYFRRGYVNIFLHLLDIVNAILGVQFCITPGRSGNQFHLIFTAKGGPYPRFLGRSDCAQTFNALTNPAPAASPDHQLSNNVWKELKDIITIACKGWTKDSAAKVRHMKRIAERQAWLCPDIQRAHQARLGRLGRVGYNTEVEL
ncbi:hypothetical protein VTJ04DRAFT_489 [Mycothermus thermophilus]|uniref:uncharacterized protein n=1 Tax=Humicola insolens TaxID=85995 RepID=UPI0037441C62